MKEEKKKKETIVAFGKGRLFNETLKNFNFIPDRTFEEFASGNIPVYCDIDRNLTCVTVRHSDLPLMLENKYIDMAIGSSVWFLNESNSNLKKVYSLKTKTYHLSLISKKDVEIKSISTIATKFKNIANAYFKKKDQKVDVISMSGNHEIAIILGFADAIIDVVETGNTIKRMSLQELDVLYELNHEIWLRSDKDFENNLKVLEGLLLPVSNSLKQIF